MITVLALVTLAAVHGAVLAANSRHRHALPVRCASDGAGADARGVTSLPPPIDLAEYRERRCSGRSAAGCAGGRT